MELDRTYGKSINVELKPGMAWLLYVDDGPSGPCGQGSRTTCPHAKLHIYPTEDAMRASIEPGPVGRNKKARIMHGVVDEWTSPGVFSIEVHE